jgi:hypothetical protein
MMKALKKLGIEGTYLNITKAICDKHAVLYIILNIILSRGNLKPYLLMSGAQKN